MNQVLRASLLLASLIFPATGFSAIHPDSVGGEEWKKEIPRPVHPDQGLVDLYNKTWEIAHGRVRKGPQGLPASPYMDENCYETDIWIWDTCFMSLFSKYAPKSFPGMQSLDNFYVPIHQDTAIPLNIHLRDNPPLFAWVEGEYYKFSGDKKRLEHILLDKKYLQKHFDWFNSAPKGSRQKCSHQALFRGIVEDKGFTWTGGASGMDNTPRGRDAGGYDKILWVDAISQQALCARNIAELYSLAGHKEEAQEWGRIYNDLKKKINDLYWDEEEGFYYDVIVGSGKPSKIKTIASYWPLLAKVASPEQAERMVKKLENPQEFGGEFPLPTLSRDDRDYNNETGNYWRGGIWLPTSYMTIKAIENYGYYELADELAEKTIRQQLATYNGIEPHTVWECYSPSQNIPSTEHGRRARPDFCGWSALGPISLFIENVLGFRTVDALKKEIHWSIKTKNGIHGINNLTFGNTTTNLLFDGKSTVTAETNKPYTLIVNGVAYPVISGKSSFTVKIAN